MCKTITWTFEYAIGWNCSLNAAGFFKKRNLQGFTPKKKADLNFTLFNTGLACYLNRIFANSKPGFVHVSNLDTFKKLEQAILLLMKMAENSNFDFSWMQSL